MAEQIEFDQAHQTLQEITEALENGRFVHVRRQLQDMEPEDIASLLEASPRKARDVLWQLTDPEDYGEILDELSEDVKDALVSKMAPEKLAEATEGMDTDDVAYVLRSLPDDLSREVLAQMDAADRLRVETALAYPEDTAGGLMNTDVITIRGDVDVDVVLRYLRMKGELPEATDALYVIDDDSKLIGHLSLATLLTTQPDVQVSEVMDDADEAIKVDTKDSDIASLFERRNWISAPVVDENQHLVGRITIDDVVDVIREDAEHSMMSMAGMDDDEDTFAPVVKSARKRSVWLGANVLAALAAASVSNMFEATLEQMAAIAVLMTIVPSMGGVAGNQTVALVIRGLALGHIGDSNRRETAAQRGGDRLSQRYPLGADHRRDCRGVERRMVAGRHYFCGDDDQSVCCWCGRRHHPCAAQENENRPGSRWRYGADHRHRRGRAFGIFGAGDTVYPLK